MSRESLQVLRSVFANRNLRRMQLALAGSSVGQWAYSIALGVYAYEVGGADLVGVAAFVRILPAAVLAPFAAVLADRYPRERVMVLSDLSRVLVLSGAALAVMLAAPAGLVFALAALGAVLATVFEPAERAILPSLAASPEELTAANVASSTIDSISLFAGPALGGVLLALTSTEAVFLATALTFLWSAALVSGISTGAPGEEHSVEMQEGLGRQALAGFQTIAGDSRLRVLIGLISAQTLVDGVLNVLLIVAALELLDIGSSGLGFLTSAVGIGGLLGSVGAIALVGRRSLAPAFVLGLFLWGVPIALIGVWPEVAVAVILLGVVGFGNTLVDVAGFTLLQRGIPDDVLARVFGVMESLVIGTIAIGGLLAPLLIDGLGIRGALLATGAFLPVLALITSRRLTAIDAEAPPVERGLELLRAIAIFAPLPQPTLEHLASALAPVTVRAGEEVFRQGDPGDRFYVVSDGEVDVLMDGRHVRTEGRGDYFGEIALLRDIPRTATVWAKTDARLLALPREEFIAAVTGHARSAEAADAAVTTRLAGARPTVSSF
jgi:MFS family permease